MKTKRLLRSIILIGLLINLTSCTLVTVNGDEEAVLVKKPWIFGHGGVDENPVTSGSEMCAVSTDGVVFKTIPVEMR